ncbi:hypothetical protein P7K49_029154 [Saguinus oedipus]|uniref:Uncharacterized protein n=1 Tax=Saguinus oedipus TaxID=9490 RepID=A0ABQ9U6E3_SAGOE|nr:hypothetical protein P7K49_029154 [Saguinus oedipus]
MSSTCHALLLFPAPSGGSPRACAFRPALCPAKLQAGRRMEAVASAAAVGAARENVARRRRRRRRPGHGGRPPSLGSLKSRGAPRRTLAEQEQGARVGGSARRPYTGDDAAGHGFCYCPGSHKRKRSSGAFCHCHPDSETDDEEEEDEQQRLLNTPRRYVGARTRTRTCWVWDRAGAPCACGMQRSPVCGERLCPWQGECESRPEAGRTGERLGRRLVFCIFNHRRF